MANIASEQLWNYIVPIGDGDELEYAAKLKKKNQTQKNGSITINVHYYATAHLDVLANW